MKEIKIKHNPYTLETEFEVEGKKVAKNTNIADHLTERFQEWVSEIPKLLVDDCNSTDFDIIFNGTDLDFQDLKSELEKFKLPVPPMEVQREIVRILDSFTLLTAELTAELTARKKQYEFYRDFLLNFNEDQSEIEWDIIDNIFIMKNGYTPSKANKDFWENGTISWYRMEDIRENGRILSESIQKITPQAVKGGKLIPKNSIIVATTATIGEHALAIADSFLMNQRFTSFTIRELLKDKLDIKFVFYYFFKICEWCKQNTNSSSFPSVDMAKLKKVKFPIPSPQTQQKVVEILDKFDTLVNSITEGLPREIELRRKQYEYYREKLLNFTELKKEI